MPSNTSKANQDQAAIHIWATQHTKDTHYRLPGKGDAHLLRKLQTKWLHRSLWSFGLRWIPRARRVWSYHIGNRNGDCLCKHTPKSTRRARKTDWHEVRKELKNVPIIMIANQLPRKLRTRGPLRERFMRLPFPTNIDELREERVIAAFWGCIERRAQRAVAMQDKKFIQIPIAKYNQAKAEWSGRYKIQRGSDTMMTKEQGSAS